MGPEQYTNLTNLVRRIEGWGEERSIDTPDGQIEKLLEEMGELALAFAKILQKRAERKLLEPAEDSLLLDKCESQLGTWRAKFRDAVGDCVVVLIQMCRTLDIDFVACVEEAYGDIKDREGTTNAQGVFEKEGD